MKRGMTTAAASAVALLGAAALVGPASGTGVHAANAATPAGIARRVAGTHYTVAPTGNAARYRVREQLLHRDLPNDAVGETAQVTGGITLDDAGAPVAGQSRIVVAVGQITSDQSRRDGYVRRRVLETDQYPTVEFVPTAFRGVTATDVKNATGPLTFDVIGDLTVHGVTHPTTWHVTAHRAGDQVTGNASTRFTFDQFGLTQPRVPIVLSVADTIALEYDFTLVRDGGAGR